MCPTSLAVRQKSLQAPEILAHANKASRGQATEAVLVSRTLSNYYWPRVHSCMLTKVVGG
jgi:hypothetical protein